MFPVFVCLFFFVGCFPLPPFFLSYCSCCCNQTFSLLCGTAYAFVMHHIFKTNKKKITTSTTTNNNMCLLLSNKHNPIVFLSAAPIYTEIVQKQCPQTWLFSPQTCSLSTGSCSGHAERRSCWPHNCRWLSSWCPPPCWTGRCMTSPPSGLKTRAGLNKHVHGFQNRMLSYKSWRTNIFHAGQHFQLKLHENWTGIRCTFFTLQISLKIYNHSTHQDDRFYSS